MAYSQTIRRLSKVEGIDAKVVATHTLFTCPTNTDVYITHAIITASTANTVTQRPVMGIGIAAGEDDMFSSRALTGFTASNSVYTFTSFANAVGGSAGDVIKLGIDNGSTATTHTIVVELFGWMRQTL